jgi:NAD+ kinase
MRSAAIISKPQKPELAKILAGLTGGLAERGFSVLFDAESAAYLPGVTGLDRQDLPQHSPDIVIVLGGDGTLLAAARAFAHTGTPLLSVNLGSLGFLTEVPLADLYRTFDAWCAGSARIDVRSMMQSQLLRGGQSIRRWDALNDVVLAKGTIARMGDFSIEIDNQLVATFRADGVIIATPTGSTAYTLAAAGPILMPTVNAMVVTPICPHLLTLRPIVVPGESTITVRVEGVPNQTYLTVDGQEAVELEVGDQVYLCRSKYSVKLVRLHESGLFNVLRSKLKWGER